jgi:hypothetical protein
MLTRLRFARRVGRVHPKREGRSSDREIRAKKTLFSGQNSGDEKFAAAEKNPFRPPPTS